MILMKRLEFLEENRPSIWFSNTAKIRLDPVTNACKLKAIDGKYSTDNDLYVLSPSTSPQAVLQWVGFQADLWIPRLNQVAVASVGFRLHDGTTQWYWDSDEGAWAEGTDVWNTEAEVAAHISTYAATTKILRVVVNLKTEDPYQTPEIFGLRLAYEANLESQQDDLIYRTLIPALKDGLRPTSDFLTTGNGTDTLSLTTILQAAGAQHQPVGVAAAFNHTDDPNHLVDIYQSYNAGAQTVKLTEVVPTTDKVVIRIVYCPNVIFETTAQDYIQVEKIPAVLLTDLNPGASYQIAIDDEVVNKGALTAIQFMPPSRRTYLCNVNIITSSGVDLQRLLESIERFIGDHQLMRTIGTDEEFRLRFTMRPGTQTEPSANELHSAGGQMSIEDIYFQVQAPRSSTDGVYPVGHMIFTGGVNTRIDP